jgi:hypothetical protein
MRRLFILALALAACGGAATPAGAPAPARSHAPAGTPAPVATFAVDDLTVALPAGWQAAKQSLTPNLAMPREVLAVATYPLRYRPAGCAHMPSSALDDLPPRGAFVTLYEQPHLGKGFPQRPRRFGPSLGARSEASACAPHGHFTDHWFTFRDHGRAFYGLVALGPKASADTRATAWHILDGLKVGHATLSIGAPQPDGSLKAPGLRGSLDYRLTTKDGCVDVSAIAARKPWCGAPVYIKRLGGVTVVAGIAPQGDLVVDGRRLPQTRDGGFLALTTFRFPRVTAARVRLRPPGTVGNDEIGENILQSTRAQIHARFGPPAATTRACDYYKLAGDDRRRGWRFCFRADGVMSRATGLS